MLSWCVRAVWEDYAGWARLESTTELYHVPTRSISADLVELSGGPEPLAKRAGEQEQCRDCDQPFHFFPRQVCW